MTGAIGQHEYGIYPGRDGGEVLSVLHRLTVPSIVVLLTVLTHPTPSQKSLLEQIVPSANAVVTTSNGARDRLLAGYAVDSAKMSVIPHGAFGYTRAMAPRQGPPRLLTWAYWDRAKASSGPCAVWRYCRTSSRRPSTPWPAEPTPR
jgi:polysaccharide biosynthesis protein PslF